MGSGGRAVGAATGGAEAGVEMAGAGEDAAAGAAGMIGEGEGAEGAEAGGFQSLPGGARAVGTVSHVVLLERGVC